MKKLIIFNLFFILCLFFIFSSDSLAAGLEIKNYFMNPNTTLEFETLSSSLYTILRTIGMILAVCLLMVLAISYMLATPQKRAELKGRLPYYVAGIVFLVAGVGILGWYEGIAKEVGDTIKNGASTSGKPLTGEVHGAAGAAGPGAGAIGGKSPTSNKFSVIF